ncbi:hypothetical protein F2Q69_00020777 [Brassica cretica]|uniref:Uncharacterized protein n=1 Tax=Brassica cretica TaxID=69181 RepID=A0A8S9QE27_BRACR|nr:hypothetical protein F2Q69_00020777 [Brassica cretica]
MIGCGWRIVLRFSGTSLSKIQADGVVNRRNGLGRLLRLEKPETTTVAKVRFSFRMILSGFWLWIETVVDEEYEPRSE